MKTLKSLTVIVGYLLAAALVAGLTLVLVAYGQGYTYELSTGQLVQRGMVILASTPGGVTIKVNGKKERSLLPYQTYRGSFKPGSYDVRLELNGFMSWEKTLAVRAAEVTLADYALLLPKDLQPHTLDSKVKLSSLVASTDRRYAAYIANDGTDTGVYVMDLAHGKATRVYTPKAATPTQPAEELTSVSWSDDASHLLISAKAGGRPLQRLIARSGGEVVDLTEQYGFDFSTLRFSRDDWRRLYWLSPEGLRMLDVEAKTVSAVLADRVSQFEPVDGHVLYVQSTDLGRSLWSIDPSGNRHELVQALAESDSYSLAASSFQGVDYVAVVPARSGVGTLYSGVYGNDSMARIVARNVKEVKFSPKGRFVTFLGPNNGMTVYDLEQSAVENKAVTYQVADGAGSAADLAWYDDFHMLLSRNGRLEWMEFDGVNRADLGEVLPGQTGLATADGRSIVAARKVGSGEGLVRLTVRP